MRLAIVTGGSRGLGLALCEALLDVGYQVLEFSRTAPHPYSVPVDLSDPIASHQIVTEALKPFARAPLDELVVLNSAGIISPIGPAASKSPAAVVSNLQTNLVGPVLGVAAIVSTFQAVRCSKVLVNISSGAATGVYPGWSLYCAAKAGMEHFVRALALEQERQPWPFLAVNVDPGVIDTDMQASIRAASESDFPEVRDFVRCKEEGDLADPKDVARRVLRILSSQGLHPGETYDVADFGP